MKETSLDLYRWVEVYVSQHNDPGDHIYWVISTAYIVYRASYYVNVVDRKWVYKYRETLPGYNALL